MVNLCLQKPVGTVFDDLHDYMLVKSRLGEVSSERCPGLLEALWQACVQVKLIVNEWITAFFDPLP